MTNVRFGNESLAAIYMGSELLWQWSLANIFETISGCAFDFTSPDLMSQDAAGTVPVTAPGQPVGLVRDQSGGGRNASQSTSAARPTSARHPRSGLRNLTPAGSGPLQGWGGNGAELFSSAQNAPLAGQTMMELREYTAYAIHQVSVATTLPSGQQTFSVYVAANTRQHFELVFTGTVLGHVSAVFNLSNGTVASIDGATAAITGVGGGIYRCSLTWTQPASEAVTRRIRLRTAATSSYQGDDASSLYVWGVQIEAGALSAYQHVTTALDVTESGQPDVWYGYIDAANDALTVTVPAEGWPNATVLMLTNTGISVSTGQNIAAGIWNLPIPRPARCYGLAVFNGSLSESEIFLMSKWFNELPIL